MKSLFYVICLSLFISMFPTFLNAQDSATALPEQLIQYDVRKYSVESLGLKDLVFEVRMDQLTETLNKNLALGKLIDVHFKVYWLAPNEWRIEVNGLPKGFDEIKSDLRQLLAGKMEYVIARPFKSVVEGLSFENYSENGNNYIRAFDPLYTKAFTDILLQFDQNGRLNYMRTNVSNQATEATFDYSVFPWSNSKFLVTKHSAKTKYGVSESTITHFIDYAAVNSFGLPSKMTIKTNNKVTIPARGKEKEKVINQEMTSVLRFSKYETNTGKAKRFIVDGVLK